MNERPPINVDHFRPLPLGEVIGAAWRRRWSAIVVAACLSPLLVASVWLIPAEYDSYGQLLVRLGRGSVSLDPTTSLTPTVSLQDSRASQVHSVQEMLQSRGMAQKVVRRVGAERILEPHSAIGKWSQSLMQWLPSSPPKPAGDLSGEQVAAQIDEEMATMKFQKMLGLYSPKDAYTIDLEVRSEDPFLSRDLLIALVEIYQDHHALAHSSVGSLEFFSEQADRAYDRAVKAKEAIREAKSQRNLLDISSAQATLLTLVNQTETELMSTENELSSRRSEIQSLISDVGRTPEVIEAEVVRGIPNLANNTMRQSLYDLEVRYKELAVKLNEDHPKLRALRDQLRAAAEIAQTEPGEQPQTKEAVNPVRQQLDLSRRQSESAVAGLISKREGLIAKRQQLKEQLQALNNDEVALAQLSWEADLAERDYLRSAESRDNARMVSELSLGKVSEIAVVQEPTLGLKKVRPKRSLLAVLMVIFAISLGVAQAVARGLLEASPMTEFHPRRTDTHGPQRINRPHQVWTDETDESEQTTAFGGVPR